MSVNPTAPRIPTTISSIDTVVHVVLAVTSALMPLLGVFAPLALAPLLLFTAVGSVVGIRRKDQLWPFRPPVYVIALSVLIAWSAASLGWTLDPGAASEKLLRSAGIFLAGLLTLGIALRSTSGRTAVLCRSLAFGFVAALGALLVIRGVVISVGTTFPFDGDGESQLIGFNRSATVIAILAWPAALYAGRFGASLSIAIVIVTVVILATFASSAAVLATIVGAVVAAATRWRRATALATAGAVAALMLALPTVVHNLPVGPEIRTEYSVPGSGYHRLLIWKFTAERIAERPLLGWGFDSSRSIPGHEARLDQKFTALPLHPHNAALQLWLELGAIGTAVAAVLILYVGYIIRRLNPVAAAASAGCFASAVTVSLLSYGIWQSWWLSALFLAAFAMILTIRDTGAWQPRAK
jgi:exopolysaccharide production protein ExoQ